MNLDSLTFDEKGLIVAVVQDAVSKEVLTVAYMNKESLQKTLETNETWFYSRSRKQLWHKGETSGNTQYVKEIRYDCDQDALVILVEPKGPACHTGQYTCFHQTVEDTPLYIGNERFEMINKLEKIIAERDVERPKESYCTYLFEQGVDKILKKVGEEAAEVIIAAKNRDADELKWEVADLIFHLMVLLREQKLPLDDVLQVLKERHGS
ncbi:bifunctional phosphoribosyl-AMP cyclohydrolase/phosphoribosyl-ATP diphosphatase HisIE [Bacillus sp. FJAT-47783]|uniref:bifunctional phosphoribosyl-AMP cyclohydrolase/phosphoribosyl-ATP diphosphatase HisIE n=1 Tax=Bacillus sp. FJAT-47783 TaxID=2922712 RepID=UPI001FADCAFA|nr:bifunctional phosphoribosyl-AMP cyclohydrolase/phosphoribosyl-ATP diphosphatase HisIE [Bacillus sp. FJAT-47783]